MSWEKVPTFLKSHLYRFFVIVITVSVFLSTLQLTALLSKSFRLRLHCYTLASATGLVYQILLSYRIMESDVFFLACFTLSSICRFESSMSIAF